MKIINDTPEIKTNLENYVNLINDTYQDEKLEGMFYVLWTTRSPTNMKIYKHTFKDFMWMKDAIKYCEEYLYRDWEFEYGGVTDLYTSLYICCKSKNSFQVKRVLDGYHSSFRFFHSFQ